MKRFRFLCQPIRLQLLDHPINMLTLVAAFCILLLTARVLFSDRLTEEGDRWSRVEKVYVSVNGERARQMHLPTSLSGLEEGDTVTVEFLTESSDLPQYLMFISVYCPVEVFIDGIQTATYGGSNTYPSFMTDPPTQVFQVRLPLQSQEQKTRVKLVFTRPHTRGSIMLHRPIYGTYEGLRAYMQKRYGTLRVLSLFLICIGVMLTISSVFFTRFENRGQLLLWPGMLCFFSGMWGYSENSLSVLETGRPSLLYVLSFIGMYTCLIPLYRYIMIQLKLRYKLSLQIMLILLTVWDAVAIYLQFTNLVSFTRSLYAFHVLASIAVLLLTVAVGREALRKNHLALVYLIPVGCVFVGTVMELTNYYFRFLDRNATLFQTGIIVCTLVCGLLSARRISDIYAERQKALQLENELKLLNQSIEAQKERNQILLSHEEEVRKQRHDLRHHLRVLQEGMEKGKYEEVKAYIEEVAGTIPTYRDMRYCENPIVSAMIGYYVSLARQNGIEVDVKAQIPEHLQAISDGTLCVICGNLLENAIEACNRMKGAKIVNLPGEQYRRISFRAKMQNKMLVITMDNTYNPNDVLQTGEEFISSKRVGAVKGTGLRSIQSMAEQFGGRANFKAMGQIFRSEVYLQTDFSEKKR